MKKRTIILLGVILITGFLLRHHNYATWPREGATFDEHAWTWLGLSTLSQGVPSSWSPHKQYTSRISFQDQKGASYTLVTPYLEHPPLFGMVTGLFAKSMGLEFMGNITLEKLRLFSLLLGILSILGVFLLASSIGDERLGLISSFVYAIIPTVVIGSRLIENENFFIPVFLFGFYFIHEYVSKKKKKYLLPGVLLVSILPLAKIPWIAAPVAVVAFLFAKKKYSDSVFVLFSTLGFFGIFLLWGVRWDINVFMNLWKLQLARYDITFDGIFALVTTPLVSDRLLLDGWIYAGWVSMVFIAIKDHKKYLLLVLGFLAYLGLFLIGIPNEPGHGWYRYPFYPFLAISLAIVVKDYFLSESATSFFFLITTGLSMFAASWQHAFGFSYGIYRGFIMLCATTLLPFFFQNKLLTKFTVLLKYALLVFVVCLTVWTSILYNEQ